MLTDSQSVNACAHPAVQNVCVPIGFCTAFCGWHTYGFDSLNRITKCVIPPPTTDYCTAYRLLAGILVLSRDNAVSDHVAV